MSAFAFAETYVFVKQSLEPILCHPLTLITLLGYPFFRRYGVNLPSSLTEVRSSTSGEVPLPTCVGVRYGQTMHSVAAFLGSIGTDDFHTLASARPMDHTLWKWDLPHLRTFTWEPILSI